MRFYIIAVGNKLPDWINVAFNEYAKRFTQEIPIQLIEIKPEKRTSNKNTEQILSIESQRIKTKLPSGCRMITLDESGQQWTTEKFSENIQEWMQDGSDTAFIIGGADGLHDSLKLSAHGVMALSRLTFPHGLARVILAEQLYRALTIIKNHPYHRI